MKTIFALMALACSSAALADCYLFYFSCNVLVWQNTYAPVPMNTPSLDKEVQKIVPEGHMVFSFVFFGIC